MRSPVQGYVLAEDVSAIKDPADYLLVMRFETDTRIMVGALGEIHIKSGYYAYTGSAKAGLRVRAGRHLIDPLKKRWHIDHLTGKSVERSVFWKPHTDNGECTAAAELKERFFEVKGFGSSDCRCPSHLFYLGTDPTWRKW
jgi:Uri superfamily endonuclease